jgi:hypothetical protein
MEVAHLPRAHDDMDSVHDNECVNRGQCSGLLGLHTRACGGLPNICLLCYRNVESIGSVELAFMCKLDTATNRAIADIIITLQ